MRALFLPPGGDCFAGRRAWPLVYTSSRESGAERSLYALLARAAATEGEADWVNTVVLSEDLLSSREEARMKKRREAWKRRNHVRRVRWQERRVRKER